MHFQWSLKNCRRKFHFVYRPAGFRLRLHKINAVRFHLDPIHPRAGMVYTGAVPPLYHHHQFQALPSPELRGKFSRTSQVPPTQAIIIYIITHHVFNRMLGKCFGRIPCPRAISIAQTPGGRATFPTSITFQP